MSLVDTSEAKELVRFVKKQGEQLTTDERLEAVFAVIELVRRGQDRPIQICNLLKVSYRTAISIKADAIKVLGKMNGGLNHMRAVKLSQYGYHLTKLSELIENEHERIRSDLNASKNPDYSTLTQLYRSYTALSERQDKIAGLNTEVNVSVEAAKRIVFVRPGEQTAPIAKAAPVADELFEP